MKIRSLIFLPCGFLLSVQAQTLMHDKALDISGMAQLSTGEFVVIHDTKAFEDSPALGILSVIPDEPMKYSAVPVSWGRDGARVNDLESVCLIPGKPYELLAAESGYVDGRFGRIFHIALRAQGARWEGFVKGVILLPKETDNIEGLVMLPLWTDQFLLLLGERGGTSAHPQGVIRWGVLDLRSYSLTLNGSKTFSAPDWPGDAPNRDIADLYLDNESQLWIASTEERSDRGPFRSVVYLAGKVSAEKDEPLHLLPQPEAMWRLDGVKVEALAPPIVPDSRLSVGTDDEDFGGTWRPLF